MSTGVETEGKSHSGMYWTVGIVSLVLTAIAFGVVLTNTALRHAALPIIVGLAVVQVGLQTFLFMHLREGRRVYSLFFGYGAVMAIIVGWGVGYVLTAYSPGSPPVQHLTSAQLLAEGQHIVTTTCESCHTVNGVGAHIGPDLNQVLAGKLNVVPGGQPTNAKWLTQWISDPQAVWSSATMPNLGLQPQQVQGVVMYLEKDVK